MQLDQYFGCINQLRSIICMVRYARLGGMGQVQCGRKYWSAYPVSVSSWFCSLKQQRCFELCTWLWWCRSWNMANKRHRPTYGEASTRYCAYRAWPLLWSMTWESYHLRINLVEYTLFDRRRFHGDCILAYEMFNGRLNLTQAEWGIRKASCVTVFFVYSGGKQPSS